MSPVLNIYKSSRQMYDVIIFRITFVIGFKLQIAKERFFNITHTTFTTPVSTSCKHSALWILKLQTLYPTGWRKRRHHYNGYDISDIHHYMTLSKRSASLG
jgi:hypothetical protein